MQQPENRMIKAATFREFFQQDREIVSITLFLTAFSLPIWYYVFQATFNSKRSLLPSTAIQWIWHQIKSGLFLVIPAINLIQSTWQVSTSKIFLLLPIPITQDRQLLRGFIAPPPLPRLLQRQLVFWDVTFVIKSTNTWGLWSATTKSSTTSTENWNIITHRRPKLASCQNMYY